MEGIAIAKRRKTSIERLAEDYYTLRQHKDTSNTDSILTMMVYEDILKSNALRPRDRQIYALHSCLCLTQTEIAQIVGISQQAISPRVNKCYELLGRALAGTYVEQDQSDADKYRTFISPEFDDWNARVIHNVGNWWNVHINLRMFVVDRWGIHTSDVIHRDYDSDDGYNWFELDSRDNQFWDTKEKMTELEDYKLTTRIKPNRNVIPESEVRMPNWDILRNDDLLGLPPDPDCPFMYGDI